MDFVIIIYNFIHNFGIDCLSRMIPETNLIIVNCDKSGVIQTYYDEKFIILSNDIHKVIYKYTA